MDATRSRRTQDMMRLRWYAYWRTSRFAAHMGFAFQRRTIDSQNPLSDLASGPTYRPTLLAEIKTSPASA